MYGVSSGVVDDAIEDELVAAEIVVKTASDVTGDELVLVFHDCRKLAVGIAVLAVVTAAIRPNGAELKGP